MVNIFEKRYFKKYLHKNCRRWWFSKNATNARYKNSNGVYDIDAYGDEYTVRVRETLEDPYLSSKNRESRALAATGHGVTAAYGVIVASTTTLAATTGPFAPLFVGIALAATGMGAANETVTDVVLENNKNLPEDVYFYITGDNSYWKAEQVSCGGIRDIAYKICKWSNEVYRERYIQRRSDDYEFQIQIEQRPPTPY